MNIKKKRDKVKIYKYNLNVNEKSCNKKRNKIKKIL